MATPLNSFRKNKAGALVRTKIIRELLLTEQYSKHRNNNYLVTMEAREKDGVVTEYISFRVKGTRQEYTATMDDVLSLAKVRQAIEDYNKKLAVYDYKKKHGIYARKPKKPGIIDFYSPIYLKVVKRKKQA